MSYTTIKTAGQLQQYTARLLNEGRTTIALDFEGEFNLHAYGERLCLIQVHDGVEPVIIDPFSVDAGEIKAFLEQEKLLKIMWDATSDISLVVNGIGCTIKSVLDLRPAADLLDFPKRDYSSMLKSVLDVETRNKSKFQRYNWLRRPIDDEAILYALDDVLYLHPLKDALLKRIWNEGHMEEFYRLNMIVQQRNYLREPGQRHKKMKGYRYLRSNEKDLLKELFELRDTHARELDWPPHRVIKNPELIELARGGMLPRDVRFDRAMPGEKRSAIQQELEKLCR